MPTSKGSKEENITSQVKFELDLVPSIFWYKVLALACTTLLPSHGRLELSTLHIYFKVDH